MIVIVDTWQSCYPSRWKGLITPDAIAHPAKFSSRLIRRIYEHMRDEGWLREGDAVIDPFGGVALGALDAMRLGLRWRGVELEAKFADLGNQNIALWNSRFSTLPHWNTDAVLLNGDSRNLAAVLAGEAQAAVSSPPYSEARIGQESGQEHCGHGDQYGATPGQLGAMKASGFEAAVTSPPFRGMSADGGWQMLGKFAEEGKLTVQQVRGNPSKSYPSWDKERDTSYGHSEGQLSDMPVGNFGAAVSSPPFRQQSGGEYIPKGMEKTDPGIIARHAAGNAASKAYGDTTGQLANQNDNDFWLAARAIVEQVYGVLAPGGHAVWVVKAFVKNKQIEDFPGQWKILCEAVGFVTIHEHRAMLVHGKQVKMDGSLHYHESKSFFRRLAENGGAPRIDYEVVYCMAKQAETLFTTTAGIPLEGNP